MTTDPELTRIVRSWLAEGVTALPDRVLDSVMTELPATPQRRRWRPAWRDFSMNTFVRFAAATAVVSILLVGGVTVLRPSLSGGLPTTTPIPTSSPSPLLPLAPGAWCHYLDRYDDLVAPPVEYASPLEDAARGNPAEWRRVGPEYLAFVREARSALAGLEGLAPIADEVALEARGLDAWIVALEASLGSDAGAPEAESVFDAWERWMANRLRFFNGMLLNFETACP